MAYITGATLLTLAVCITWNIGTSSAAKAAKKVPLDACFKTCAPGIPKWHIYHRLCKPIILGHRGNPLFHQENTMEGFKSAYRQGVSGFELDVFLTKDKKLVLFHDLNTLRSTGDNRNIQGMTSTEIKKLRYLKSIKHGTRIYTYRRRPRLTFLHTVLRWAKNKDILLFIELKPHNIIIKNQAVAQNSIQTGVAVAKMVKSFGMVHQVIVDGTDNLKTLSAKRAYPQLVIGTFMGPLAWKFPSYAYPPFKAQLQRLLPGLKTCLIPVPATTKMVDFLYLSGTIDKSIKASFSFIDYPMFNNPTYGGVANKNTLKMMKQNYGPKFVVASGVTFEMHLSNAANKALVPKFQTMIRQGVPMFVTDDIRRFTKLVRRTLGRRHGRRPHFRRRHRHHHRHHYGDPRNEDHEIEAMSR